ncbi:MAG: sulfurtransferase [Nitriliruptoraceae bacterium]
MGAESELLVSASWVADHLDDDDVVVVDCPWDGPWWKAGNGGAYGRAHIPGAVCQSGHAYIKSGTAEDPSVSLPSEPEIVQLAAELGIGPESTVVVYDEGGSLFAARLWWVLTYSGHADVRVLDGGWQAWIEAGLPVSARPREPATAAPFTPRFDERRIATLEQALGCCEDPAWQAIDARSQEEWTGSELSGNRRGGHMPGAVHCEWNRLLEDSDDVHGVRRFRPAGELRSILEGAGVDPDTNHIPYCQAAVRGAFMGFALELAGFGPAAVYDGSMAEWANLDTTPLTTV